MTSPDNSQILSQYNALKSRFDRLYSDANLSEITQDVSENTRKVDGLSGDIAKIRSRGYAFASYLEQKADVLAKQWEGVRGNLQGTLESEARRLRGDMELVRVQVEQTGRMLDKPQSVEGRLPGIERELDEAESKLKAATQQIKDAYSALGRDIAQASNEIGNINWCLDQKDEASFPFLAAESLFLAAKAEWVQSGKGKDDPDGILYLTDQRLVFEQKETTGKKLGLFGGKKTQELEWEIPLNQIESVEAENKGLFGGKDMLNFTLGSGAPFGTLTVEVKGGVRCKFWAAQIQRMISGDTSDERAIQPDEETLESIRNAPTACHVCAATLPTLVAGQLQIECLYCGTVIRL